MPTIPIFFGSTSARFSKKSMQALPARSRAADSYPGSGSPHRFRAIHHQDRDASFNQIGDAGDELDFLGNVEPIEEYDTGTS